jgi:hypothetical protein
MPNDSLDHNRLLIEMDRAIQNVNREIINPEIPELTLDGLTPVISMVARARSEYLKSLLDITELAGDGLPTKEQTAELHDKRRIFEELMGATKALETAINRGYLDVSR